MCTLRPICEFHFIFVIILCYLFLSLLNRFDKVINDDTQQGIFRILFFVCFFFYCCASRPFDVNITSGPQIALLSLASSLRLLPWCPAHSSASIHPENLLCGPGHRIIMLLIVFIVLIDGLHRTSFIYSFSTFLEYCFPRMLPVVPMESSKCSRNTRDSHCRDRNEEIITQRHFNLTEFT